MKPLFTLFSIISLSTFLNVSYTQPTIEIPWGTAPTIDGAVSPGEWDTADTVYIPIINGLDSIPVLFQYDSSALYLAYLGNLESSAIRFPEAMIDVNHDRSADWMEDDWWFHVSATDCEYQGQYGNYDSCQLVRPTWTGAPNFTGGANKTDTVEIEIPFATLGLNWQTTDTFGIAFNVTNTATNWEYWPEGASKNSPATWAHAIFSAMNNNTGLSEKLASQIQLFPNPASQQLHLEMELNQNESVSFQLIDVTGKTVLYDHLGLMASRVKKVYQLQEVPAGFYFAKVHVGNSFVTRRIMIYQ